MKLLSSDNNSGMLLKNPKGLISKGTQMYKITSGTSFAGLTQFPVFEIVSFDDSSNVTKISNTKIQLTADEKYRLTCEAYGDGSSVQQFGFYDVTNSQFVGNYGVGAGLTTSIKAELIIRPTVTTEIEVRPVATSTFTTQYIWTTYVEEVESNVNDTAQTIKQMTKVYNTVVDMQSSNGLKLGDVVETLGYTTVNDSLGRKYIITATDIDSLGITVGSYYASKFEDEVSRAVGYVTNFTSATGTVIIPSGLPIGTRRLIRKVNATQGTIIINCTSETFTVSELSAILLNSNGDFWLLEKVTSTRWDLIDGRETGTNANGLYYLYANGTQSCIATLASGVSIGASATIGVPVTFPKSFGTLGIIVNADVNPSTSGDFFGVVYYGAPTLTNVSLAVKNGATAQTLSFIAYEAKGRWY